MFVNWFWFCKLVDFHCFHFTLLKLERLCAGLRCITSKQYFSCDGVAVHALAGWLILVFIRLFIPGLLVKRRLLALQPDDETGVFKAKTAWVVLLNIVSVYVHMCVSISKVLAELHKYLLCAPRKVDLKLSLPLVINLPQQFIITTAAHI